MLNGLTLPQLLKETKVQDFSVSNVSLSQTEAESIMEYVDQPIVLYSDFMKILKGVFCCFLFCFVAEFYYIASAGLELAA